MKTNERKYLEISTAHLKQKTLEGLNAMEPPYTYEYEEGIFMSVPAQKETISVICQKIYGSYFSMHG